MPGNCRAFLFVTEPNPAPPLTRKRPITKRRTPFGSGHCPARISFQYQWSRSRLSLGAVQIQLECIRTRAEPFRGPRKGEVVRIVVGKRARAILCNSVK